VDFVNSIKKPTATPKARAKAACACLSALLDAAEFLLRHAPRDWSLRQLLGTIARQVPVKLHLGEAWSDAVQAMLRAGPIWFLWSGQKKCNVLDQACNSLADQLAMTGRLPDLLTHVERTMGEALSIQAPVREQPEEAGPVETGLFLWKGKEYTFPLLQWRLLKSLWQDGRDEEDARREVYGRRAATANTFWQLQKRTQDRLDTYRLPFKIIRPHQLRLFLKKPRSLTRT
jgi:hypothetical protein